MKLTEFNHPDVVAEVNDCCTRYEQALIANDADALIGFFLDSPLAIRFGIAEELYGSEAISNFRNERTIHFTSRTLVKKTVVGLDMDKAVSNLELEVEVFGSKRLCRQTQVWCKFDDMGWRIVSAHVSHNSKKLTESPAAYVSSAAALLDIPIEETHRSGVIQNIAVTAKIMEPLMKFELDDDVESAAHYQP